MDTKVKSIKICRNVNKPRKEHVHLKFCLFFGGRYLQITRFVLFCFKVLVLGPEPRASCLPLTNTPNFRYFSLGLFYRSPSLLCKICFLSFLLNKRYYKKTCTRPKSYSCQWTSVVRMAILKLWGFTLDFITFPLLNTFLCT